MKRWSRRDKKIRTRDKKERRYTYVFIYIYNGKEISKWLDSPLRTCICSMIKEEMQNPRSISLSYSEVNIRFETTPFGNVKLSHCYEYTPLYHDATFKNDFIVRITEWSQFTVLISCIMLLKLWTCWKTTTHNVLYFFVCLFEVLQLNTPDTQKTKCILQEKSKTREKKTLQYLWSSHNKSNLYDSL